MKTWHPWFSFFGLVFLGSFSSISKNFNSTTSGYAKMSLVNFLDNIQKIMDILRIDYIFLILFMIRGIILLSLVQVLIQ